MCEFVSTDRVMPGIGCCRCRTYNGLQRPVCARCGEPFHAVEIPPEVNRCPDCGWGWIGELPKRSLVQTFDGCPCCAAIKKEKEYEQASRDRDP
jgi:hypothetical protein